ncbi:putative bifunctional diguanylate cyclase/phosphodiesterase [Chthonobacter rhizosphaerae]|uniref:putative bifunctional diguanylate cyclase/phosphodiesterase n=1 Tax=Chthonobacter rhizosphaerae TaxID=2735553 RepID=UPI0015EE4F89|nr:EAL domain-containing protein [Chthonobacter rhizosphaerae]
MATSRTRSWLARRSALRAALDCLPQGIVLLDRDGRYVHWNPRYAEIYKGSADLFAVGRRLEDTLRAGVARGHYPEAIGREGEWLAGRMAAIRNPAGQTEQQLADGRWILIDERQTRDGGYVGIRVDITERKKRETSFRILFDDNPVPMVVLKSETDAVLAANRMAIDVFGDPAGHLIGVSLADLSADDADTELIAPDGAVVEHRFRDRAGTVLEMQVYARPHVFEGEDAILVALFDVTERNRAKAEAAYLAHHDPLTGLANRAYLHLRLRERLGRDQCEPTAVLLVDLDHFKAVNDTLGHHAGDHLLQEVARRLVSALGPGDFAARLGGDEFVIVTRFDHLRALRATIDALLDRLHEPLFLDGSDVCPQASVGIAIGPADGAEPDLLLRNADLALYRAKAEGRGTYRFFEAEMDDTLRRRRALELELRAALETGDLTVHYQPLVDLASGTVTSLEALVRWHHPERGAIPPSDFIPLAEETNLIGRVGEHVLRQACRDAVAWPGHIRVAVNLSPLQFRSGTLFATVDRILAETGLHPARLELEITEALLLERTEQVLSTLHALRALGVRIAMDDFGTGYSSLSYLRSFPFDKIKIDQSFIRDLALDKEAVAIVRAIIHLGSSLGMKVTAEGIEDPSAAAILSESGCHEGQGYHFSRPRPQSDVLGLLAADGAARAIRAPLGA